MVFSWSHTPSHVLTQCSHWFVFLTRRHSDIQKPIPPPFCFNLLLNTLDINLYICWQQEIGLYSFRELACWILGTRVISICLNSFNKKPVWKKDWTALVTHLLTTSQYFWKKWALNPSVPGALSGLNWRTTFLISISYIGLISHAIASPVSFFLTTKHKCFAIHMFCNKHKCLDLMD